jgi:hypothetical protein
MIDRDGFEGWLIFMDETIQQFVDDLPEEVACRLDFTPGSLEPLELWLLNKYASPADILQPSENWLLDRVSRYVGETIRRAAGGNWGIDLDRPNYVFYGIPEIRNERGGAECPASLVTASLDRRRGNYMKTVVQNMVKESP